MKMYQLILSRDEMKVLTDAWALVCADVLGVTEMAKLTLAQLREKMPEVNSITLAMDGMLDQLEQEFEEGAELKE